MLSMTLSFSSQSPTTSSHTQSLVIVGMELIYIVKLKPFDVAAYEGSHMDISTESHPAGRWMGNALQAHNENNTKT